MGSSNIDSLPKNKYNNRKEETHTMGLMKLIFGDPASVTASAAVTTKSTTTPKKTKKINATKKTTKKTTKKKTRGRPKKK